MNICIDCQSVIIWVKEYDKLEHKRAWVGYCRCSKGKDYNKLVMSKQK